MTINDQRRNQSPDMTAEELPPGTVFSFTHQDDMWAGAIFIRCPHPEASSCLAVSLCGTYWVANIPIQQRFLVRVHSATVMVCD